MLRAFYIARANLIQGTTIVVTPVRVSPNGTPGRLDLHAKPGQARPTWRQENLLARLSLPDQFTEFMIHGAASPVFSVGSPDAEARRSRQ